LYNSLRSISIHSGSSHSLDHRGCKFPSTTFSGDKEAFSIDDESIGLFNAILGNEHPWLSGSFIV